MKKYNENYEIDNLIMYLLYINNLDRMVATYKEYNLEIPRELMDIFSPAPAYKSSDIEKYFLQYETSKRAISTFELFIPWKRMSFTKDRIGFLRQLKALTPDMIIIRAREILEIDPEVDWMEGLKSLDLPHAMKWLIWEVIDNPNEFLDLILKLLETSFNELASNLKPLNALLKSWNDNLSDEVTSRVLNEIFQPEEIEKFKAIHVCGRVVDPYAFDWYVEADDLYIYVGYKAAEFFETVSEKNQLTWAVKALGYMVESSRMKILKMLKSGPCNSDQIAKETKLGHSTISHHMNALTLVKLIDGQRKDGKILYDIRMNQIEKVFDVIKESYDLADATICPDDTDAVQVLSDKHRQEVLLSVVEGPKFSQDLKETLGIAASTMTHHLNSLQDANLILVSKIGRKKVIDVNKDELSKILYNLKSEL